MKKHNMFTAAHRIQAVAPARRTCAAALALLLVIVMGSITMSRAAELPKGSALQHASIVLDWYPNSDHGGLYTAMQRGFFRQHHVSMSAHVPSDTSAQIKLVAAGSADFGITYETDLLAARAQHIPVRSVMCIMQHPLDTVMALKSSGITRPRDLQGKRVGMAGSPSDIPIVSAMVKDDHGSMRSVHMINVGYSLLTSLLAKKVDAVVGVYWTWEAIQAEMKGYPVNVMRVERWGVPNYCELVLVASEKTINSRPGLVRDTVQAMQQGYAYAEAHPVDAWKSLTAADKTLQKQRSLVVRSVVLLRRAVTDTPTIGRQDSSQWQHYASWLAANKLIARRVVAQQAFTNQFLRSGVK